MADANKIKVPATLSLSVQGCKSPSPTVDKVVVVKYINFRSWVPISKVGGVLTGESKMVYVLD